MDSYYIKRKLITIISIFCLATTSVLIMPTSVDAAPSKYVKSLTLAKSKVSVSKGKSVKVKATVKVKGKPSKTVSVKSSNTKVASVKVSKPNSKGVSTVTVTGKKKGSATITVKTKAKNKKNKIITKKFKVTVKSGVGSGDTNEKVIDADEYFKNHRLVPSPMRLTFKSERGDTGFIVDSGVNITATSSDTSVVRIETRNGSYYAVPVSKGSATVTVALKNEYYTKGWDRIKIQGNKTRTIDVTVSDWVSGDDAKGRPAINDSLNSDDIRIWQETSVFDYDDVVHNVEAYNFLMAKNGITEYGYGKLRTIVPYNQLSDGAKKTLARLGDKTYVTKLEPMQDGYQDYWVAEIDYKTLTNTVPGDARTGYTCYNGELDTPYTDYWGRCGNLIQGRGDYLGSWTPETNIPPVVARVIDKQGLVGIIRDADGTRHWYKSYNGVNVWSPKAEGVMGMGGYLRWPDGTFDDWKAHANGYPPFGDTENDPIPYFYDEFYTDKPSVTLLNDDYHPAFVYGKESHGSIKYEETDSHVVLYGIRNFTWFNFERGEYNDKIVEGVEYDSHQTFFWT